MTGISLLWRTLRLVRAQAGFQVFILLTGLNHDDDGIHSVFNVVYWEHLVCYFGGGYKYIYMWLVYWIGLTLLGHTLLYYLALVCTEYRIIIVNASSLFRVYCPSSGDLLGHKLERP